MTYEITGPAKINTEINLSASKSISNRTLIINAMAGGVTRLAGAVAHIQRVVATVEYCGESELHWLLPSRNRRNPERIKLRIDSVDFQN